MKTSYIRHLFLISLYFEVLYAVPAPVNFTILSHNFKHILHWNPGINSSTQTVFNIKQRCGDRKPTMHLDIRNTTMDVSDAFEDIYASCIFFIWASLDNIKSSVIEKRITPYEDTTIGPPIIFLSGCGDCLNINISLPNESWKRDQLHQFYNSVNFNISWKKYGQNEVSQISVHSKQTVLKNLRPGDQYCVKVLPHINSNHNTQPSAWQCEYTSKEELRGVLHSVSWSLGVALSGLGVMVLMWILVYTGFVCRPKTLTPKALSNIVPAYCLNPEQMLSESVSSTEAQLIVSNDTNKNNSLQKVKEDSENKEYEDNILKSDIQDEEEDHEDEVDCIYMSCEIDNISWKKHRTKKNIVSTLPFYNSSRIYSTNDAAMENIHCEEDKYEKESISEVFEEGNRHLEVKSTQLELEGNEKHLANGSGNINLFSVILRTLGPQDALNEDGACKPLLPKLLIKKDEILSTSCISPLEKQTEDFLSLSKKMQSYIPIQTEMKTDELMHMESQDDLIHVCSLAPNIRTKHDAIAGYTVTHMGSMHEQNRSLSETDCDTGYLTR